MYDPTNTSLDMVKVKVAIRGSAANHEHTIPYVNNVSPVDVELYYWQAKNIDALGFRVYILESQDNHIPIDVDYIDLNLLPSDYLTLTASDLTPTVNVGSETNFELITSLTDINGKEYADEPIVAVSTDNDVIMPVSIDYAVVTFKTGTKIGEPAWVVIYPKHFRIGEVKPIIFKVVLTDTQCIVTPATLNMALSATLDIDVALKIGGVSIPADKIKVETTNEKILAVDGTRTLRSNVDEGTVVINVVSDNYTKPYMVSVFDASGV